MFTNFFSIAKLQSLLFTAPVVLLAIVCHEFAHGFVSNKLGDPTAKYEGRLTLNPLKHIDLIGALCMLFFHVGWAKPVPINPIYYRDRRKGIIYVSLAGPVANFIIAFISLFVEGLFMKFGSGSSTFVWIVCQLCYYSAAVNIGLALFNLIPIPPLDGSKVLSELSYKVRNFYYRHDRYWQIVLLLCVLSGFISKPLNILGDKIIDVMWWLVKVILVFGI